MLEHFQAKWMPVRLKKMRRIKSLERFPVSRCERKTLQARSDRQEADKAMIAMRPSRSRAGDDRPGAPPRETRGGALRRRLAFPLLLAAAAILPLAGILVAIELDRKAVRTEETLEARSFINLSVRNTARLIESTVALLRTLDRRLTQFGSVPEAEIGPVLERWSAPEKRFRALALLGNGGEVRATSGAITPDVITATLRAIAHGAQPAILTVPDSSPDGPDCTIIVIWPLSRVDGRPNGTLAAVLDPAPISDFFRTLELGPEGAIFLLGPQGEIAAGSGPSLAGADGPAGWAAAARALPRNSAAQVLSASAGGERWIALGQPVTGSPFTLLLVRDSSPALQAWRNRALAMGVLAGAPLLVACALVVATFSQARTLRTQSRIFADQAGTLATILESVDDAIIAFDPDGRIRVANRAAARLLSPDANGGDPASAKGSLLVGHALTEFGLRWRTAAEAVSPDPRADRSGASLVDDLVWRACAGERIGPVELAAFSPRSSDPIRLVATLRPIPGQDGTSAGAVLALQDRTGERAIEERLRHSEKMQAIGQLTGGVAHDFNNLLLVILGGAEELADRLDHDPAARRTAALITQAAERGAALTRRLLALARRQTLAPRIVDVPALLRDSLPLLTRTAGASVSVAIHAEPGVWQTRIDPEQLVIGLVNLVANARDAMPGGGRVTISVANETLGPRERDRDETAAGDHVVIRVSDTGTGMTAEVRTRAIEPFFSTKGPGAGTGLGLSMVYGFVRQSGGRLRIESQSGLGTRVSLLLPRAEGAPAGTEPPPAAGDSACPTGTERVLVMEPDPLVATRLCDLLTGLGYRVACTASPAEARDRLVAGAPFDLLVTDAELPDGLDGPGLARLAQARQPALAVLLTTTGEVDPADEPGSPVRIAKPWHRAEIARRIRAALAARA